MTETPSKANSDSKRHKCEACGHEFPISAATITPPKTDGREVGDWKSRYDTDAISQIRLEALFVAMVGLSFLALIVLASVNSRNNFVGFSDPSLSADSAPYVLSFVGGGLGGTMFAIKWLYHTVARGIWNVDRRLWRFFTPFLSAGGALTLILLSSTGVLPIFGEEVVTRSAGALGISILLGYFSDKVFSALEGFARQNLGAQRTRAESPKIPHG